MWILCNRRSHRDKRVRNEAFARRDRLAHTRWSDPDGLGEAVPPTSLRWNRPRRRSHPLRFIAHQGCTRRLLDPRRALDDRGLVWGGLSVLDVGSETSRILCSFLFHRTEHFLPVLRSGERFSPRPEHFSSRPEHFLPRFFDVLDAKRGFPPTRYLEKHRLFEGGLRDWSARQPTTRGAVYSRRMCSSLPS